MPLLKSVKWRVNYKIRQKQLQSIDTVSKLLDFARKHKESTYLDYLMNVLEKQRKTHEVIVSYIGNFQGKAILELGPGYGHFLNLASEGGASTTFIDYNPYIFRLNMIHGHRGYLLNYQKKGTIDPFRNVLGSFDIIFCRGALNADQINRRYYDFNNWLYQLLLLLNPGGIVIITPTYDMSAGLGREGQPCSDVETMKTSYFTNTMLKNGFQIVNIDGYTDPTNFPFTFVYDRRNR